MSARHSASNAGAAQVRTSAAATAFVVASHALVACVSSNDTPSPSPSITSAIDAPAETQGASSDDSTPDSAQDSTLDVTLDASPESAVDATSDTVGDLADASPTVVGMSIVARRGAALEGPPGAAIPLAVVVTMSDGTTIPVAQDRVMWTMPSTVVATDPKGRGPASVPETGVAPTAFYIENPYRDDTPGVLFVLDPGTMLSPGVTVEATVADAGTVRATVNILPALVGDPVKGGNLFQHVMMCATCHGATGGGSVPATYPDGGPELIDGAVGYIISGELYPFPAPGLNAAPDSGHVASDPAWNAALFSIAAQSDIDNQGVALRMPMPYWLGGTSSDGGVVSAQDFADIYAWLRTQTK